MNAMSHLSVVGTESVLVSSETLHLTPYGLWLACTCKMWLASDDAVGGCASLQRLPQHSPAGIAARRISTASITRLVTVTGLKLDKKILT